VNDLDEDENELNFDFDNMPEADLLLNGSITEDEIKRAINNLKKMVRLVGMMVS
jgi:hypothetical protein